MEIGVKRGPPVHWYRGTVLLLFLWCGPVLASSPAFDALLVEAGWAEKISGDGTGALLGIVGEDACMEEVGRHECEATRLWPKSDPAVLRIVEQSGWVVPAFGDTPAEVWIPRLPYGSDEPVIPRFGAAVEGDGLVAIELPARAVVSPGPAHFELVGVLQQVGYAPEAGLPAWADFEVRAVDARGVGSTVAVWAEDEPAVARQVKGFEPEHRARMSLFVDTAWDWCVDVPSGELRERWLVLRTADDGQLLGVDFAGIQDLSVDEVTCLEINGWRLQRHAEAASAVAFFAMGQVR